MLLLVDCYVGIVCCYKSILSKYPFLLSFDTKSGITEIGFWLRYFSHDLRGRFESFGAKTVRVLPHIRPFRSFSSPL